MEMGLHTQLHLYITISLKKITTLAQTFQFVPLSIIIYFYNTAGAALCGLRSFVCKTTNSICVAISIFVENSYTKLIYYVLSTFFNCSRTVPQCDEKDLKIEICRLRCELRKNKIKLTEQGWRKTEERDRFEVVEIIDNLGGFHWHLMIRGWQLKGQMRRKISV